MLCLARLKGLVYWSNEDLQSYPDSATAGVSGFSVLCLLRQQVKLSSDFLRRLLQRGTAEISLAQLISASPPMLKECPEDLKNYASLMTYSPGV